MAHIVQVRDYDGNNKFQINILRQKVIDAAAGETIVFDQSDSSNAGHPLRIALYPDGAHLYRGSEYTPGVTFEGTPGQAGAKTTFTVSDANLHGTYFYYCENHRFMGGMIHYGNNPAKYRLIDEGATASDAQDEDLTSNIVKTVEQYNELTELWDHVYDQSTNHSNPWAVQNTDTRNSSKYRIRYEVQDSQGLADINTQFAIDAGLDYSTSRQKLINISSKSNPILQLEPNQLAYLDGQVFTITSAGNSNVHRQTFLILHPDRVETTAGTVLFNFALAGIYNSTTDEFTVHDHQYSPFMFGVGFYPNGRNNEDIVINGPAVLGGELGYLYSVSFAWGSSVGFTGELVDFDIKARRFSGQAWDYNPTNPSGAVNVYYGDYTKDASVDKPQGMRASVMGDLVWNRRVGTDWMGNGLPIIKPPPGLNKPNLQGFSHKIVPVSKYINDYGWVQSNGYMVLPNIKSSSIQPYFAGGGEVL